MDSQPSQLGRLVDHSSSNSQKGLGRTSSSLSKSISEASSQSLASILNNPHVGKSGVYSSDASWGGWWSSSTAVTAPEFAPLAVNKTGSELTRSDFQRYLAAIAEPYGRFEDIRNHSNKESVDLESIGGQGEALVACLREVPSLYFKEDFALEDGGTFRAACPFSTMSENLVLQEKLSQYLDVVELHLVKEISLRSNSFFEAQGQLEDLNVKIVEGCSRIRELKETIRLLDADLVDSARQIQDLNATRSNLLALQQKLRLILYVNQALSALKLLVASADCAGALDVTDDLQHLLEPNCLLSKKMAAYAGSSHFQEDLGLNPVLYQGEDFDMEVGEGVTGDPLRELLDQMLARMHRGIELNWKGDVYTRRAFSVWLLKRMRRFSLLIWVSCLHKSGVQKHRLGSKLKNLEWNVNNEGKTKEDEGYRKRKGWFSLFRDKTEDLGGVVVRSRQRVDLFNWAFGRSGKCSHILLIVDCVVMELEDCVCILFRCEQNVLDGLLQECMARRLGQDGDELTGLHCFRHLRDHVAASIDTINNESAYASSADGPIALQLQPRVHRGIEQVCVVVLAILSISSATAVSSPPEKALNLQI
ncbi:hypothetical protein U1Q18_009910 [Sarracenia purpurea var. burkii]